MNITFFDKEDLKYTFVHIPKTAGKSISAYLMRHSSKCYTIHEKSHATIEELRNTSQDLGFTFAVVRNPYSRVVSLYKYLFEDNINKVLESSIPYFQHKPDLSWYKKLHQEYPKLSFSRFIHRLPYMPLAKEQYKFLPVDKIMHFETIENDFKFIQKKLSTGESLYKFNNTNNKSWKTYYTNDTAEKVYDIYKKDFEILNYSKDINNNSSI